VARVSSSPSSPATDALDRLFRQLVRNLAELDPARVHGPVEVSELYQRLIPYRTHRTHLGLDTHEDYEMVVLRLLAGERGYALVEPAEAREALAREVAAVNPDTGYFKRYGSAKVTFDPGHVRAALGGLPVGDEEEAPENLLTLEPPPPLEVDAMGERAGADAIEAGASVDGMPFALEEETSPSVSPRIGSAPCSFCGGELPVGRAVIFCPHCGQNVGVVHCPSCGTELDFGWRFCITCGRQMAPPE
jgi:Double zinc ribbon